MHRLLLICFFIIYSGALTFGQPDTMNNENYEKSNILKITPLRLIGLLNPGIEISLERRTGDLFSTQLSVAYLFPERYTVYKQPISQNITGFIVSGEEKFYIKKRHAMVYM